MATAFPRRHHYMIRSCCKNIPPSSHNSLVFQAARLLIPPARFQASKLKVAVASPSHSPARIVPRTYTLSHCDFTANLTLSISDTILPHQLKGWYSRDDVVAEWTQVNGVLILNVHCYVSGQDSLTEMAAEFRYHIFSKELPIVLQALLHGDSDLFREHQGLMDAGVRVYFHSGFKNYNRVERWGPLKDAALGKGVDKVNGYMAAIKGSSSAVKFWAMPIFQAVLTFLL